MVPGTWLAPANRGCETDHARLNTQHTSGEHTGAYAVLGCRAGSIVDANDG
jgi:hypothetical protein